LEIPRGRKVLKAKTFKGMYKPKLEFQEGWGGSNQKKPPWGEYGYFLEQHNGGAKIMGPMERAQITLNEM